MLRDKLIKLALLQSLPRTKTAGISDFFNATSGVSKAVENAKRIQAEGGTAAQRTVNASASSQPIGEYANNLADFSNKGYSFNLGLPTSYEKELGPQRIEAGKRLNYLEKQYPNQLDKARNQSSAEGSLRRSNAEKMRSSEAPIMGRDYSYPPAEMPELSTPWKMGKK